MSGERYRRQFGFRILISDAWNATVSAELPSEQALSSSWWGTGCTPNL